MPIISTGNSDQPERLITFSTFKFGNFIHFNNQLDMADPLIKSATQDRISSGVRHPGGQMCALRKDIVAVIVLSMTYIFTRLWLGSAWSEHFWTWLNNQLSAGFNPGLTSDLELIVVLIGAFALSVSLVLMMCKGWNAATRRRIS